MTLTLEKFQEKFMNKMQNQYPDSYIKDEIVTINSGLKEFGIPIHAVYCNYLDNSSFNETFKNNLNIINKYMIRNMHPVNYHNIYPIIRNKDFEKDSTFMYYRKPLFLDLEILLVEDRVDEEVDGDVYTFCGEKSNIDESKAYEAAWFNINKLKNKLILQNNLISIYSSEIINDYCSSLILNVNFRKQIREKVGKSFLLAFSSTATILIGCDCPEYVLIMKELMKYDGNPSKVSSRVYRIKGDIWEYAD